MGRNTGLGRGWGTQRAPHPAGLQQQLRAPRSCSSFTWQGLLRAEPGLCLQGREEEQECARRDLGEAGHSMGWECMALHSPGSRACLWAEPAHLSSTGQGLAAGRGHRVGLQSRTKAGLSVWAMRNGQ